ncbi:MAG TPA: N-methyl-L-tryptophan oxidase [Gemmatimonadaceae bacterium]|jgi:sarcosine oxidase
MSSADADVIVLGAGAMGTAAAYHLAHRGARVVVLDRWSPPHTHGSSHGRTRIIREAYFEHPAYVPLVRRAYALWSDLERESGRRLFLRTGGLTLGAEHGILVPGALRSAREHGVWHETLTGREIARRFPALRADPDTIGVLEQRAGILFAESCVEAMRDGARAHDARLHYGERAQEWRVDGATVTVTTDRAAYHARRLILAAGAWLPVLAPSLGVELRVERQVAHWMAPGENPSLVDAGHLPVTLVEYDAGRMFYAIPDVGDGLKAAIHHDGPTVDPDVPPAPVTAAETEVLMRLVERFLPCAAGAVRDQSTCLYTNTPDGHFILDAHPGAPEVIVVSACSGHGFKFAIAIGEVLADIALNGEASIDLSPFRLSRFASERLDA